MDRAPPIVVVADATDVGERADVVLARRVPGLSRAAARAFAREGKLRIGKRRAPASTRVAAGTRLELHVEPDTSPAPPLQVLHASATYVFVNKPAGVHTVRVGLQGPSTLADSVAARFPECAALPEAGALHRLDEATTGVVAFGRTPQAMHVGRDAIGRSAVKLYLAQCHGSPSAWPPPPYAAATETLVLPSPLRSPARWDAARVTAPLRRVGPRGAKVRVDDEGMPAVSIIWPLHCTSVAGANVTTVCVQLATGRQHQARAHLAHLGLPVIGDARYGADAAGPLRLHAWSLDLGRPDAGPGPVLAPLPATFTPFG